MKKKKILHLVLEIKNNDSVADFALSFVILA